jgi:hypothetical protein
VVSPKETIVERKGNAKILLHQTTVGKMIMVYIMISISPKEPLSKEPVFTKPNALEVHAIMQIPEQEYRV